MKSETYSTVEGAEESYQVLIPSTICLAPAAGQCTAAVLQK